jgi:hypothetical protein
MIGFIDDHRAEYGVEPICRVLPIAPSTFYEHQAVARDPARASDRAKRDEVLRSEVQRVWDQNFKVYGVRKVWHLPLGTLLRNALPGSGCAGKASMWPAARWNG